jgi:hypothetical protein
MHKRAAAARIWVNQAFRHGLPYIALAPPGVVAVGLRHVPVVNQDSYSCGTYPGKSSFVARLDLLRGIVWVLLQCKGFVPNYVK